VSPSDLCSVLSALTLEQRHGLLIPSEVKPGLKRRKIQESSSWALKTCHHIKSRKIYELNSKAKRIC
jgi:hypothetical protein